MERNDRWKDIADIEKQIKTYKLNIYKVALKGLLKYGPMFQATVINKTAWISILSLYHLKYELQQSRLWLTQNKGSSWVDDVAELTFFQVTN